MIPTFKESAACEGKPTELWFSENNNGYAKSVCRACPAKQECLAWALKYDEWGVWGETTYDERRRLKGYTSAPRPVVERQPRRNLTQAERDYAMHLTELGRSAAEIASELRIHERTVRVIRAEARESA